MTTDDLRAKLERVEAYLKHDVPTLTGRLFWAYGPTNENDERTADEAADEFLSDLSTLLDQAARVEALDGALRKIASLADDGRRTASLPVISRWAAEALSSPASTSPSVGGGDE